MTNLGRVRDYYDAFDEWGRLDTPEGQFEYEQALALLDEYLLPSSAILDLGGGPGRYTIALARRGHRVWLADLSPRQLDVARVRIAEAGVGEAVVAVDEVNATALDIYPDAMFDAVVAFGPFYHLILENERRQAAREVVRLLRPDGLLFAAFIPRPSGLAGLIERAAATPGQVSAAAFLDAVRTGVFRNTACQGLQEAYFPTPGEILGLFSAEGLSCEDVVSLRGMAFGCGEALLQIRDTNPDLYAQIVAALRETRCEPAIVGLGGHAVYVGRR